jgi:type IV pilus assembly protein PilW
MQRRATDIVTRAGGFSLVELMVAITLSLLLLTGVVAIFSSSRVSYESNDQLSRIQETGRFALEVMSKHVRAAGFSGCAREPKFVSTALNNSTALQWNFLEGPVRGYDASATGWTPALDASITGVLPGTDVLVVRGPRLDVEPTRLTAALTDPQQSLVVASTAGIRATGDVVMAFSCEALSVFFATPAGTNLNHGVTDSVPGNSVATTSFPFTLNTEVIPVETVVYYVAASQGATPPNNTLPVGTTSLWRRVGLGAPEELVQGVENMQLEFGLDNDPNNAGDRMVDNYVAASATTDWQQAIAVRVALLVRSVEQYGADADQRTYQLLTNTTVNAPGDRRLREVFTTTIGIRSRARVE